MHIKPRFDSAAVFEIQYFEYEYKAALAIVWQKKRCGVIDKKGKWILKPDFDTIRICESGIIANKNGEKKVYSHRGKFEKIWDENYICKTRHGICGGSFSISTEEFGGDIYPQKFCILRKAKMNIDTLYITKNIKPKNSLFERKEQYKIWENILLRPNLLNPYRSHWLITKIYNNKKVALSQIWLDTMVTYKDTIKNGVFYERNKFIENYIMHAQETPFYDTIKYINGVQYCDFVSCYWVEQNKKQGLLDLLNTDLSVKWYDEIEYGENVQSYFITKNSKNYGIAYSYKSIDIVPTQYKMVKNMVTDHLWLVKTHENQYFYLKQNSIGNDKTILELLPKGKRFSFLTK